MRKATASLYSSESMVFHIPRDGGLCLYRGNRRSGFAAQSTSYGASGVLYTELH